MRLIDADVLIEKMNSVIDEIDYRYGKLTYDSRNFYEQDWERGFMFAYGMVFEAETVKYN